MAWNDSIPIRPRLFQHVSSQRFRLFLVQTGSERALNLSLTSFSVSRHASSTIVDDIVQLLYGIQSVSLQVGDLQRLRTVHDVSTTSMTTSTLQSEGLFGTRSQCRRRNESEEETGPDERFEKEARKKPFVFLDELPCVDRKVPILARSHAKRFSNARRNVADAWKVPCTEKRTFPLELFFSCATSFRSERCARARPSQPHGFETFRHGRTSRFVQRITKPCSRALSKRMRATHVDRRDETVSFRTRCDSARTIEVETDGTIEGNGTDGIQKNNVRRNARWSSLVPCFEWFLACSFT